MIVSGLPWAAFTPSLQDDLLDAVTEALAPHATFIYHWRRPRVQDGRPS